MKSAKSTHYVIFLRERMQRATEGKDIAAYPRFVGLQFAPTALADAGLPTLNITNAWGRFS